MDQPVTTTPQIHSTDIEPTLQGTTGLSLDCGQAEEALQVVEWAGAEAGMQGRPSSETREAASDPHYQATSWPMPERPFRAVFQRNNRSMQTFLSTERKIAAELVTAVYIPPKANVSIALSRLYDILSMAGAFNQTWERTESLCWQLTWVLNIILPDILVKKTRPPPLWLD